MSATVYDTRVRVRTRRPCFSDRLSRARRALADAVLPMPLGHGPVTVRDLEGA